MFRRAIVRSPARNLGDGETSAALGAPDFERALEQHLAYHTALVECGLMVARLEADEDYPDSTFVEDLAVLTVRGGIVTRPGAVSRRGEIVAIQPELRKHFANLHFIREPGTVDGGDVCEAGEHFFIGISQRTNEEGAEQLARLLRSFGYGSSLIDIRGLSNILHLKSGLAYLSGKHLVVSEALRGYKEFSEYDLIGVKPDEEYAANCVLINGKVLVAAGFNQIKQDLEQRGYQTIALEMSEFRKMDGGLSCLSLRF